MLSCAGAAFWRLAALPGAEIIGLLGSIACRAGGRKFGNSMGSKPKLVAQGADHKTTLPPALVRWRHQRAVF